MIKRNAGRRFLDKNFVKFLFIIIGIYIGHFITIKFPGVLTGIFTDLKDAPISVANYVSNLINGIGGLAGLALIFQIVKWFIEKEKKK